MTLQEAQDYYQNTQFYDDKDKILAYTNLLEIKLETLADLFPQYNRSIRDHWNAVNKLRGCTEEEVNSNSPAYVKCCDAYQKTTLARVKFDGQIEDILNI